MSGIVRQLNILGHIYILFYMYKLSYYRTDCPLFTKETHDGTLPESWEMMFRQCFYFKILGQKFLASCTSSIYEAMYTYYCSCTNGHHPELIALSSQRRNMIDMYHKVEKWCLDSVYTLKFIGKYVCHSAPAQYIMPYIHIILQVQMVILRNRLPSFRTGNIWWHPTRKMRNDV